MAVATLAAEVVFVLAAFLDPREMGAERDQLAHRIRTIAHDRLDRGPIAQARTRPQRVLDVRLERIIDAPHARDSALRVGGVGLVAGRLGQHRDAADSGGLDREDHAGDAAANYQAVAARWGSGFHVVSVFACGLRGSTLVKSAAAGVADTSLGSGTRRPPDAGFAARQFCFDAI